MIIKKISDETWEVYQESCLLGFIIKENDEMFFDMKAGLNPSLELKELQEIVKLMESVK